jgi:multimeric flavodoxin WrbA
MLQQRLPAGAAWPSLMDGCRMRAMILNAALDADPLLDQLTARLTADFVLRRYAVESFTLREIPIAFCQGCFECWTHTPGTCKIDDAGRKFSSAFSVCDAVVIVTPVQFGSYSSEAKKMLDRILGTLLPFFRRIDGEVHHVPRYKYPPSLGVLAVTNGVDAANEQTVRTLALRNAINFGAPMHTVQVVSRRDAASDAFGSCDALVSTLTASGIHLPIEEIQDVDSLLPFMPLAPDGAPPRRALLLVGSGKPHGTSTSESLGGSLALALRSRGVEVDTRYVARVTHSDERLQEFVQEVRTCDLLLVASPVYIDALPALVTKAFEAIATDRADAAMQSPLSVAMLLNCGFPESRHAAVARTIGALFAGQIGARWAGALQLGGGGAVHGQPLEEAGRVVSHIPQLLDDAAASLANGHAIAQQTIESFRQQLMPTALYMAAGDAGWIWTASHEGALTKLWHRPAVET